MNFICMNPCIPKSGTKARTRSDSSQLAVNAIVNPHTIVPIFCTIKESVSPTMLFTAAASVERRAPIAPLQNPKNRLESCTPDSAAVGYWNCKVYHTLGVRPSKVQELKTHLEFSSISNHATSCRSTFSNVIRLKRRIRRCPIVPKANCCVGATRKMPSASTTYMSDQKLAL